MPPVTPTIIFALRMGGSIPAPGRPKSPVRRGRRSGTIRAPVWRTESAIRTEGRRGSGQQGAEPALVGGSEGVAASDRPRGATQGGDPGRLPRALRHLREEPEAPRLPALAPVLVSTFPRPSRDRVPFSR